MSGIRSVTVAHDTRGARTLGRANNPDAGVIVAPELRRRFELGWALLEALGKRSDVTGSGRNDEDNWELLCAWLTAHRIEHLVLLDAQWLPPALVADICGLSALAELTVWLVAHHEVPQTYRDALDNWPHRSGGDRDLAEVAAIGLRQAPDSAAAEFPKVPADSWPTFRHAAATNLDPDGFAVARLEAGDNCWGHLLVSTGRQVSAVLIGDGPVWGAVTVDDDATDGRVVAVSGQRRGVRPRGQWGDAPGRGALSWLSWGAAA